MFDDVKKRLHELRLKAVAKALESNGFKTYVVSDKESARELVLKLIPPGSVVGVGGSVSIRELGLIDELVRRGFKVIHHWVQASPEEVLSIRRQELLSDVFLCRSNAVILDGKLINIDDIGNRVAAMIFGPKRVIVVAGRNKIVRDVNEGISRAKNVAAIMNYMRYNYSNPCVSTGTALIVNHLLGGVTWL